MKDGPSKLLEIIQKLIVKTIATHRAGFNLSLIGGFRFRLLDNSPRMSIDIDYHYTGDLNKKQKEIIALFKRKLLPEIKTRLGYDGTVTERTGPDADSPSTRIIDLAFFKKGVTYSRIELSVDITCIECLDKPIARTFEGTVFLTASDRDMIESKIIALFDRTYMQERDIIDIFLFKEKLGPDSGERIFGKLANRSLNISVVAERFDKLLKDRYYHVQNINAVINGQFDIQAAETISTGGGAEMVFDYVMENLREILNIPGRQES